MSESDDIPSPKRLSLRRQSHIQQPDPLRCPRCESTNTKFCYFNNYNKTQPRYFCKACKRHWTKGGTLRNVPIGGGRRNKRLRPTTLTATATATATVKNHRSIDDQDSLLPDLRDPNETFDVSKDSSMETIDCKRSDDAESYTDIEELKGMVSWDFYDSFIGCKMQDLGYEDISSRLAMATNMIMPASCQETSSTFLELNNSNWNDLDKPWEDPTFKT